MSEEGGAHDERNDFLVWDDLFSDSDFNSSGGTTAATGTGTGSSEEKISADESAKVDQQQQEDGDDEEALQVDETKKKNNKRGLGKGKGASGSGNGDQSDHETHILIERERRKKMKCMFTQLNTLLPPRSCKEDKTSIVDGAISYIKTLEQTFENLQKLKLERIQAAAAGTNVNNLGFNENSPMNMIISSRSGPEACPQANQVSFSNGDLPAAAIANNISATNNNNISNSLLVSPIPAVFQTWASSNVVLNICGDQAHISVISPKKPGLVTNICYVLEKHGIEVISAQVSSESNQTMLMIQAKTSCSGASSNHQSVVEEMFKQAASELMRWVSS